MLRIFEKHGPITIFIFALTPLPDDLLFIPLGVMRYPFTKALIPALLGKIIMTFILAYSGQQSIEFIQSLFSGSGWIGIVITIVLLIIVIIAMIKIDWEQLFEKHFGDKKTKKI